MSEKVKKLLEFRKPKIRVAKPTVLEDPLAGYREREGVTVLEHVRRDAT